MICGAFAAFGGILAASRLLGVSAQSSSMGTLLLEAITAAVVGGTSLFGGRGSPWSALFGALAITSISNGIDLLGLGTEVKLATQGIVLYSQPPSIPSFTIFRRGLRPSSDGARSGPCTNIQEETK